MQRDNYTVACDLVWKVRFVIIEFILALINPSGLEVALITAVGYNSDSKYERA